MSPFSIFIRWRCRYMGKKKWKIAIGILLIIVAIIAAYFCAGYFSRLKISKEITNLLQPMLTEENKFMHLHIETDVNGDSFLLDSDIYMVDEDERSYVVMEQMNVPIYITENLLFFENGHAFKLSEEVKTPEIDYKNLFLQIAAVYDVFDFSCVKTDLQTSYAANVTGEQVQELLEIVMPMESISLDGIESLNVEVVAQKEQLHEIKLTGNAVLDSSEVTIEIILSKFQILEAGDYEIPETVKQAVVMVDESTLFNLTEDVYRLYLAFDKLTKQEMVDGKVTLDVNCGILHFENSYALSELETKEIESVDEKGVENLPAVIGFLCMESEIRSIETTRGHAYTLTLDEASMQKISEMVVPELVNYVIDFTEGNVEIMVEEDSISSIKIEIGGDVNILFSEIPMEVFVHFNEIAY